MTEPSQPSRSTPDVPPGKKRPVLFAFILQALGAFGFLLFMEGVVGARLGVGVGRRGFGGLSNSAVCWVGAVLSIALVCIGSWLKRTRRN